MYAVTVWHRSHDEAAKRALRHHKKVKALVTVQAKDAAGNAGGITKVIVKPKVSKRRH